MEKSTMIIYAGVAIGVAAVLFMQGRTQPPQAVVDINFPELTPTQVQGQKLFSANCAVCHGNNATGTGNGPNLIQKIYQPRFHADGAFFIAAKSGVRAHHWQFGSMPPVEGVEKQEIARIVEYVRALQRANGIK
jgi:mono/diheme cytochrome c family protein